MSFSLDRRRWATVAITLGLAFASGHFMQNALAERGPFASGERQAADPGPLTGLSASLQMPALATPPVLSGRTREAPFPGSRTSPDCRPRLVVSPAPGATIRIDLHAPCQAHADVDISQGEVHAAVATDADGRLHIRMPAFSATPEVMLDLDGHLMKAALDMPEAKEFRHVALLWNGPQALRINAYEFGAGRRDAGHVWSGSPKTPVRAVQGTGGYLTRIGDGSGSQAEIYSFPALRGGSHGVVRLVVEAEVAETNCGQELRAQALQSGLAGGLVRTEIALAMPGCDRVGEIVRLQNLLRDMRLAGR